MGKGRGRCENGASLHVVVCEKLHSMEKPEGQYYSTKSRYCNNAEPALSSGTVTPSPLIEWYLTPLRCPAGVQPGPARAARRDRSAWRSRGGAEVVADGAMAAESRASSALPALAAEAS
jgi:hypothetical protein